MKEETTMSAKRTTERERFEAWAKRQGYCTDRVNGKYDWLSAKIGWLAWQARARLERKGER